MDIIFLAYVLERTVHKNVLNYNNLELKPII